MIDIVIPDKEHQTAPFEALGKKLGYETVYVVGKNLRRDLIMNSAGVPEKTRHAIEKSPIHIFYNLEVHGERDGTHQRKSGFNHVLAALAHDKEKMIAFNFNTILTAQGAARGILLGRMRQNVMLCRRYKVPMLLISGATNLYEMRAAHDMLAFGELIGMAAGEAKTALEQKIA
ncbi:MAG: RNase P subunit p30 family protein [Candidatus Woesearchaeota archaeon]|nr:RNase P subunit p30 family protein [Candidatus Woesearchaeota archaeon]